MADLEIPLAPTSPTSGLRWISVRGGSMYPSLQDGDEAGFVPVREAPHRGDVLVVRCTGGWVVHRVVQVSDARVVIRGDNCLFPDAPSPLEGILGRVESVRRAGILLEKEGWDRGPSFLGFLRIQGGRWWGRARRAVKVVVVRRGGP